MKPLGSLRRMVAYGAFCHHRLSILEPRERVGRFTARWTLLPDADWKGLQVWDDLRVWRWKSTHSSADISHRRDDGIAHHCKISGVRRPLCEESALFKRTV
jgi:hypothetical protein